MAYVVRDDEGKPIATFEAPGGASEAQIAAYAAQLKREALAARAARERRRLEPQTSRIKCTWCAKVVALDQIGAHIESHAQAAQTVGGDTGKEAG